jgi:plasmid stability protein
MPSITIRNVPEDTHRELASRAALAGQSLQEYLREALVEMAGRPDVKTLMERVRASKERDPIYVSAEQILEYRDEGRRSRS